MGGRFQNSIALAKASWNVLRSDRKLVLLPVISGIVTLLVAVSFLVPAAIVTNNQGGAGPVGVILAAIAYFVAAYVVIFFNAALVYAADAHLHCQPRFFRQPGNVDEFPRGEAHLRADGLLRARGPG